MPYIKFQKIYRIVRIKPLTLGDNSGRINVAKLNMGMQRFRREERKPESG